MLVISELAESLEAHRKGYRSDKSLYDESLERISLPVPAQHKEEAWAKAFVSCYKDTVEDELADAYIRLCDFIGGFGLDVAAVLDGIEEIEAVPLPDTYGECLLGITFCIVMMEYQYDRTETAVALALQTLEALAIREGIDLATHIDLKLRYNTTRPAKHGKAY